MARAICFVCRQKADIEPLDKPNLYTSHLCDKCKQVWEAEDNSTRDAPKPKVVDHGLDHLWLH